MKKTFYEIAVTFLQNAAEFAKSGFELTPVDVLQERLKICHSCEFFEEKWFAGTGRCGQCYCSIEAKLRMASSSCPINKWTSYKSKQD